MYRIRKKRFLLAITALSVLLSACGSTDKLMTDAGSGGSKEISKEEYLDVEALKRAANGEPRSSYKVHTLEKGIYTEAVPNQTLEQTYANATTVKVEVEKGTIRMGKYLVSGMMVPVEKGETIATIYTEVDSVDLEEARLQLSRLQEKIEDAEEACESDLEKLRKEKKKKKDKNEKAAIDLQCEQRELDLKKEKNGYQSEIEAVNEEIADLEDSINASEIKAPVNGYVVFDSKYAEGDELQNGSVFCHILAGDELLVHTTNYAELFSYGMDMEFSSGGNTWSGTVVNAGSSALYGNLDTGETIFSVEAGSDIRNMRQRQGLTLQGLARSIENVVLVPKEYVTVEEDSYYVTVLNEDGSFLKTEFIPGGGNTEVYWVYAGLTEGTQIVYQ